MKEGWKMVKFEKAIQKVTYTNKINSTLYKSSGNFPIISQEKELISGYWDNVDDLFIVKKPLVIFGDHTKVVKYVNFDFVLGADGVKILLPTSDFDSKFFYYYVSSVELRNLGYARHFKLLKEREIPLPPLEEQHRIVSILDAAFEKIDKLKANAEENLKNAKALFQQVLAQELKPKEGWVEKKLGEVVESITDGDHQPPPKSNKGIPFITISSINKEQRSVEWNNTFFVPKEYFDGLKEDRKPKRGDILYTVTGSYGIPVLIDFDIDFCFQRHIAIIRPNPETAYSEFVNYWLLSKYAMLQAEDTATGAAQKTVSLKSLRNFSFDYPLETSEQQRIVQTLDALSEKCRRLETIAQQTIRECDALKRSILRQAFSGEL